MKRFGLFHYDPDHTDDQMDGFVGVCRDQVERAGGGVDCFGAREGMELTL